MKPGQIWRDEIRRAISASDYFIALLSTNSVSKRGYFQKELKEAMSVREELPGDQSYLIPVRLDNCKIADQTLQTIHWVDLYMDYDAGLRAMLASLFSRHPKATGSSRDAIHLCAVLASTPGGLARYALELVEMGLDIQQVSMESGLPDYADVFVVAHIKRGVKKKGLHKAMQKVEAVHRLSVLDPDYAPLTLAPVKAVAQ